MRSGGRDETYRIVLDESSFEFHDRDDDDVRTALAELGDLLEDLADGRHVVARSSSVYEVECRAGLAVYDLLSGSEQSFLSRDQRLRLSIALSRMPHWDEVEPAGVPVEPRIAGRGAVSWAPSVGYALLAATVGVGVACVVVPRTSPQDFCQVTGPCGTGEVFFFSSVAKLPVFWRATLKRERVDERRFFDRAEDAFPSLCLHEGLSFSRFDGRYRDLLEPVVDVLAAINDEFTRVWRERGGQPHDVEGEMRSFGVVMTKESVNTRASKKHMSMRDVEYGGATYRCEWHAKLEPHRNRIHFALPCAELSHRVLIGIFVDHLPTP